MTRWTEATGGQGGRDYAARFDALAASGADVHGEATLVASLALPGARVLDAGCGTGRVAIRLAELGYAVTGTDVDASMLEVARDRAPEIPWVQADLATLDSHVLYALVVVAGNVVPLVAPGTEAAAVSRAATHVAPGGLLVTGFGLDRAHLPKAAALVTLADYDTWCRSAGLTPVRRLATWGGDPYDGGGYAVSIHSRPLVGTRLRLESLSVEHAEEMAALMDDESLHTFMGGMPLTVEQTRERFARQVTGRSVDGHERWFNWVVREQTGDTVGNAVGTVQATVSDTTRGLTAEVAWVVGTVYQGKGFAQEAAQVMVAWLHAHGVVAIAAHVHPDHMASQRVAQWLGMTETDVIVDGEVRWEG